MRKKTASKSILSRAKPVTQNDQGLSALFYGRSGTGKTTLSGTFPKPMLILDIGEKGTDSLADMEGVEFLRVNTWSEFEEVYWELKESDHHFKTVTVDALHSLQVLAIREAKELANKKQEDQTSQKDFGQAGGLMNTWTTHYRDLIELGLNVVFLAHDRVSEVDTDDDADMIMPEVGPRLMPSVASSILGAVNVVGSTYIREQVSKPRKAGEKPTRKVEYCLRIGPHGYYATKIRRPKKFAIPEFIVDPTYGKLKDVIQGKGDKPTASPKTKRRIRRGR